MRELHDIKVITRPKLEDLKNWLENAWLGALRSEGFGRYTDKYDNPEHDASDELASLLHYERLMCFYESTPEAIENRERFVIDYIAPFYKVETLAEVIIDHRSSVKRVVRNVAMLYKQAATRRLVNADGSEHKGNGDYQSMIRAAGIHVMAKQWHRLFCLCDAVAVRPVIRKSNGRARLEYDVLAPNGFRVALNADNEVTKFLYQVPLYDASNGITEYVVAVWTNENHYYVTQDGEIGYFPEQPEGRNPYGVIPWVVISRDRANPYTGGMSDLIDSNLYINFVRSLESEDMAFAAINIPFGVNLLGKDDKEMKWSPRGGFFVQSDLREGVDPKLEFVSGKSNAEMLRMVMDKEERSAMAREGLPAFMLTDNAQEMSGAAMRIALTELLEQREDDALVFEDGERRIFEATRTVVNYEAPRTTGLVAISPDAEFTIDFAEQRFSDDPIAQYEFDRKLVEDNLLSYIDLYRIHVNPDAEDEKEVNEKLQANREQNSRLRLPQRATPANANAARVNPNAGQQ
jgi:hypothetical protein